MDFDRLDLDRPRKLPVMWGLRHTNRAEHERFASAANALAWALARWDDDHDVVSPTIAEFGLDRLVRGLKLLPPRWQEEIRTDTYVLAMEDAMYPRIASYSYGPDDDPGEEPSVIHGNDDAAPCLYHVTIDAWAKDDYRFEYIRKWSEVRKTIFGFEHQYNDPFDHASSFKANLAEAVLEYLIPQAKTEWVDLEYTEEFREYLNDHIWRQPPKTTYVETAHTIP